MWAHLLLQCKKKERIWLWGQRSFSLCLDSKPESRQMTSEESIIFITFCPSFQMFHTAGFSSITSLFYFSLPASVFYYGCFCVSQIYQHKKSIVFPFIKSCLCIIIFCLKQPYLKSWSQDLGVPILSVDYSLAPEAPFPRALEECFYAYCWALRNHHLLGICITQHCLYLSMAVYLSCIFSVSSLKSWE